MPEKYARYSIQLAERAIAHNNKMRDIWPTCLERQMRVYEEREITAIGLLIEEFVRMIDQSGFAEEAAEDETARFRSHICNSFIQVKDHVRRAFRNNHYYEMGEAEWEQYLTDKEDTVLQVVSGELDKFWRSPSVSRSRLKSVELSAGPRFREIFDDVFKKARIISIRAHEEEVEEQARYSSYVALVTGLPYPTEDSCK